MRLWPTLAVSLLFTQCLSPVTLDRAAMAYDDVTTRLVSQQLLLNIARSRHHHPIHFTGVASITATFDYRMSAGGTPVLTGDRGNMLAPFVGTSVAESPTFSIVPIEGEEFTRRLLMPIPESRLTMLLRQGTDIDIILRLITSEFRTFHDGERIAYFNRPHHHGYETFRQIVLHLSSIQDRHALYVEPLHFRQTWDFPAGSITPEGLNDLLQTFSVEFDAKRKVYRLSRPTAGRIVITNYDPDRLSNDERMRLNEEAELSAPDELMVDIRPDHAGGEMPIRGRFRIRSFHNVLEFLGRDIADEHEYDVQPDPRTPPVAENPVHTLEIIEAPKAPDGVDLSIKYQERHYAVQPNEGYQWNREAFRLLAQLFQMTVKDLPQGTGPGIAITK